APPLGAELKALLAISSMASFAVKVPVGALIAAIELGRRPVRWALDELSSVDPARLLTALAGLAAHLGTSTPAQLQAVLSVEALGGEADRAAAFGAPARHADEYPLGQLLAAADRFRNPRHAAATIVAIAPRLPAVLLAPALAAAESLA